MSRQAHPALPLDLKHPLHLEISLPARLEQRSHVCPPLIGTTKLPETKLPPGTVPAGLVDLLHQPA